MDAEFKAHEQTLIYALMNIYGFTVTEAVSAFNNDEVRKFLFANIENRTVGHAKVVNMSIRKDTDISEIIKGVEKHMHDGLARL